MAPFDKIYQNPNAFVEMDQVHMGLLNKGPQQATPQKESLASSIIKFVNDPTTSTSPATASTLSSNIDIMSTPNLTETTLENGQRKRDNLN